eukprot:6203805-Pleurochrysis_carterae.AAC.1
MAECGGVPVRRSAVDMRSHIAASVIAGRAYTFVQKNKLSKCYEYLRVGLCARVACADCSGRPETNFVRARAHRIRSAHQVMRLWPRSVQTSYADSPMFAV